MLKETGKVVAVECDGLWIETLKQSACVECAAKRGCGQKLLAALDPASDMTLIKAIFSSATERHQWQVGDQVVLGVEENTLVYASLIAYGVPLLLLAFGVLLGSKLDFAGFNDGGSVFGAAVGLLVGGVIVRFHAQSWWGSAFYQAQVIGLKVLAEHRENHYSSENH